MTHRSLRLRRPATWLLAALLGAAGALTVVTPAQAAVPCRLAFRAIAWPMTDGSVRWQVDATATNIGAAPSSDWRANIRFPATATVPQWWNVKKLIATSTLYWRAQDWNKVVLPGKAANFGFEVRTPDWETSPLPTSSACSMVG